MEPIHGGATGDGARCLARHATHAKGMTRGGAPVFLVLQRQPFSQT